MPRMDTIGFADRSTHPGDRLQPEQQVPALRRTWAACLELGGLWLLLLVLGLVLALVLVLSLMRQQEQALHEASLQIAMQELRQTLETDLALGLDLSASARAQNGLERLLARDSNILAAEIFDPKGVSLFSTDRAAVGEVVPQPWLDAATGLGQSTSMAVWRASVGSEMARGLARWGRLVRPQAIWWLCQGAEHLPVHAVLGAGLPVWGCWCWLGG